jgi:hypothetical protein
LLRLCLECGGAIQGRRADKRFCSDACRWRAWDKRHPRPLAPLLLIAERSETPESRRNRGKAIAASNHAPELELARRLALELLAARGVGTISDLREYAAEQEIDLPFHLPWTASVFLPPAKRAAWFEPTGERIATRHLRGHARKVNEYRLTPEGRRALEEMRR